MSAPIRLHLRDYGTPRAGVEPVLLLHGLFGSSGNWHGIARILGQQHRVLVPDLRGHGRSPAGDGLSYPAMAADLLHLLDDQAIPRARVIGHSMGGKVAMWLALTAPQRVATLTVVDIAPVTYPDRHSDLVAAWGAIPLATLRDRREADARLALVVPEAAVRGYLLQNLEHTPEGWRWRLALAAIAAATDAIRGFPDPEGAQFPGPTLFVYGTASDYLAGPHLGTVRALFPLARLRPVAGAGHWVHADQPAGFLTAIAAALAP
ncbi:MAG TPA: alpha/beta fold hydrolase [Chromatiaceae bacterium]|nr:alpha/beta fold hydrolase [Chromatiaceae bacterium]